MIDLIGSELISLISSREINWKLFHPCDVMLQVIWLDLIVKGVYINDRYLFVSHILRYFDYPKVREFITKFDKLLKYLPHCTRYRAITSIYYLSIHLSIYVCISMYTCIYIIYSIYYMSVYYILLSTLQPFRTNSFFRLPPLI